MSQYLAPIHTWLFNKIKLHEELEKGIISALKEAYDSDKVTSLFDDIANIYGSFLEDRPIEELIDESNIHGWLQEKIRTTETREAAFITEVIDSFGIDVIDTLLKVYTYQGTDCGKDANIKFAPPSAPKIYEALNSYILNGMPCDRVNSVVTSEDNIFEWQNTRCLHIDFWRNACADANVMYKLRDAWISSFVSSSNNDFQYSVSERNIEKDGWAVCQITKK